MSEVYPGPGLQGPPGPGTPGPPGPATPPGGVDQQVQYNDNGAFAGDATFLFNKTTKLVTFQGSLAGAGGYSFQGDSLSGFTLGGTSILNVILANGLYYRFNTTGFLLAAGKGVYWWKPDYSGVVAAIHGTQDLIEINNGTVGQFRDLNLRSINAVGNVSVAGTLGVTGNAAISGNLNVTGTETSGGVNTGVINSGPITASGPVTTTGVSGTIANGPAGAFLQAYGSPTNANANAAYMAFHRPGIFAGLLGIDTDNQWRIGGWSYGVTSYRLLHEQNSFVIDGAGNLNAGAKNVYSTGIFGAGSVTGTYLNAGALNGPWDARVQQTIGVTPGATVTAITVTAGQIVRILVNGAGAINLPAAFRWAAGSPVWGLAYTIISGWTDGSTVFATTVPFNA